MNNFIIVSNLLAYILIHFVTPISANDNYKILNIKTRGTLLINYSIKKIRLIKKIKIAIFKQGVTSTLICLRKSPARNSCQSKKQSSTSIAYY